MKIFFIKPLGAFVIAIGMLAGSVNAQSPDDADKALASKTTKKVVKKKKSQASGKAKFLRGSEETTAERSARLKRECLGGVNAGVCAGYTR